MVTIVTPISHYLPRRASYLVVSKFFAAVGANDCGLSLKFSVSVTSLFAFAVRSLLNCHAWDESWRFFQWKKICFFLYNFEYLLLYKKASANFSLFAFQMYINKRRCYCRFRNFDLHVSCDLGTFNRAFIQLKTKMFEMYYYLVGLHFRKFLFRRLRWCKNTLQGRPVSQKHNISLP